MGISCRQIRDMPGPKGPEVEPLYAKGAAWLAGGPI